LFKIDYKKPLTKIPKKGNNVQSDVNEEAVKERLKKLGYM